MATLTDNQIITTFAALINKAEVGTSIDFEEFKAAVEHGIRKNGWMRVRGIIQFLINNGIIVRDDSNLSKELYTVLKHIS